MKSELLNLIDRMRDGYEISPSAHSKLRKAITKAGKEAWGKYGQ